jgi:hypothetical protein
MLLGLHLLLRFNLRKLSKTAKNPRLNRMSRPSLPKGAPASALTEYRKNRMVYANFLIQQQNQTAGSLATITLESGVAPGSIIPVLKTGALYTTEAERDEILLTSATPLPSTPPQAPSLQAVGANESLLLLFAIPSDGGSPILNYEYSLDNGLTYTTVQTTQSPIVVSGLTNGTPYTALLRAVNKNGPGQPSNVASATPVATRVSFTTVEATTWVAPNYIFTVQYLIVGGGGGSGGGYDTGGGAGGGGGMVLTGTLSVVPGTTYSVVVGDGGAGGISNRLALPETPGDAGSNSSFASVTALGGGGGYASRQPAGSVNGNGGSAAVPPTTASAGGNGGGSNGGGGGGGGSSGAGGNKSGATGGTAGAGTASSLSGSSTTYGVGGAGGNGGSTNISVAGAANTGNGARGAGAGSGADEDGAKGGSGIVVIVY